MKLAKCITPKNFSLTENKEYDILDETETKISIRNDKDKVVNYSKSLFKIEDDEPEPEPEKIIPPLTLEALRKGINVNIVNLRLIISLPEQEINENLTLNDYIINISRRDSNVSCGVAEKNSINSIYGNWINFTQTKPFKNLKEMLNQVTDDDIDFENEIFLIVISSIFNKIINYSGSGRGIHLIISLKKNDFQENCLTLLKQFYPTNATIINNNSTNEITTFIIDRKITF